MSRFAFFRHGGLNDSISRSIELDAFGRARRLLQQHLGSRPTDRKHSVLCAMVASS